MKKIILLLIPLLLLCGCQSKNDELFTKQENKVKEELKDINKINQDTVKEKYLFLKENYENYDKSKKVDYIYSAKFIQTIGAKVSNDMTKMADQMLIYIKKPDKDNFEKLDIIFKNVIPKEDKLVKDIYNSYVVENLVKEVIKNKTEQVAADLKDKNQLTTKNLKAGINYIKKNIENPFKNEEVLNNLVYYSMFFNGVKKSGNVQKLGMRTLDYLKTLDDSKYQDVISLLSKMNVDKDVKKALGK